MHLDEGIHSASSLIHYAVRSELQICFFEKIRQLALIESDLIQAVGRASTLRTDATVELYSNFLLRISNHFIF